MAVPGHHTEPFVNNSLGEILTSLPVCHQNEACFQDEVARQPLVTKAK